jgi:hypothetical protein
MRSFGKLTVGTVLVASLLLVGTPAAADDTRWFKAFEGVSVAPVDRNDTTQLVEVGTIETDGFSDLVISLGCEFKEGIPRRAAWGRS